MVKHRTAILLAGAILAIALITSCTGLGQKTTGIHIEGGFEGQRSILPGGFPLDCVGFRLVSAVGDPSSIDQVFPLTGGDITAINAGLYHFTVYALNSNSENLGEQYAELQVNYGEVATLHVTVNEYGDDGTASGTLTWEPDILPSGLPTFGITMTKTVGGAIYTMPFTLSEALCSGSGGPVTMPPGWYTAVGVLADVYGHPSTGFAAAVRIAASHNTLMALALHAIPTTGGSGFTFTWTGTPELQISGSPAPGDIAVYHSTSVPMEITSAEIGFTVTWFINGVQVGTGASWTLDPSLMVVDGSYRLDAVAISADRQRASSLTWTVNKGLYAPNEVRVSGVGAVIGFPSGAAMYFELRHVETPDVIYGTVTTDCGTMTYSFEDVPPGDYYLSNRVPVASPPIRWWSADGGVATQYGEVIHVPTTPGATFNFLAGHVY